MWIGRMKKGFKKFHHKCFTYRVDGIGVIEIILILVIIIGLVLIFRNQIVEILQTAFNSINDNASGINDEIVIQ